MFAWYTENWMKVALFYCICAVLFLLFYMCSFPTWEEYIRAGMVAPSYDVVMWIVLAFVIILCSGALMPEQKELC